jgi:hypothetical protein
MIRRFAIIAAAFAGPVLALTNMAQAGDAGTPHYPDLVTFKLTHTRVVEDGATQRTLLRFTNVIGNRGAGPLELQPVYNATTGQTDAFQSVKTHNAGGVWSEYSRTPAGSYEFHAAHNHWHFADFARYELRSVTPRGGIGPVVHALSDKVSFCVIDIARFDATLEHAASATYWQCNQTSTNGLSVGWADLYLWNLAGQELDITDVPNGTYWLMSTVDPANHLLETNDFNNRAAVKVKLTHQP